MNIPIEQAEQYAIELRDAADCYADRCAYALAMEIQRLRAQLATQEQAIQERGIALADALRERDEARLFLGDALNERDKMETTITGLRDDAKIAQGWIDHHAERAAKADADNAALRASHASIYLALGTDEAAHTKWPAQIAALRADKERLDWLESQNQPWGNHGMPGEEAVNSIEFDWFRGDSLRASIDEARAVLGPENPRANCTLVAFDGAERTVTLQFEQASSACIGEKWVAMKEKT